MIMTHTSRCSTVLTANCISISSAFPAFSASNDMVSSKSEMSGRKVLRDRYISKSFIDHVNLQLQENKIESQIANMY